ncbi:SDR family NAD(P)-dependent oxidoreductase, partial [Streptomyces sp. 150FB]|uniref:SDR family NAD(P)-dependent oxidoreductase n=1 Tax=Streptomyces sp. 150FB TaxID=1576605 RepID=UPI0005890E17
YWYENLRRTVEFEPAVRELAADGFTAFIECSPHPVVAVGVQETLDAGEYEGVVTGSLRRDDGGPDRFLASLAQLWTGGGAPDWAALFAGTGARTLPLPTYAFQRERYWPAPAAHPAGGQGANSTDRADRADSSFWDAVSRGDLPELAGTLDVSPDTLEPLLPALSAWHLRRTAEAGADSRRYRIGWQIRAGLSDARLSGRWFALVPSGRYGTDTDAAGTADSLVSADALESVTAPVLDALARYGADLVTIPVDPATAQDRTALAALLRDALDDAGRTGIRLAGVLSLLALDQRTSVSFPGVPAGVAGTLLLAQTLTALDADAPLWCVTSGAVSVGATDRVRAVRQAAVWGLGQVVALEQPRRWGGLIDLPEVLDRGVLARLAAVLSGGADGEDQVAVRPSGVFTRRLGHAPARPADAAGGWQPAGTVLVTGGTGALGAHVARWLARSGAERLVLTGRRGPEAPGAAELAAELGEMGVDVTVVACDVTDRAAVAAMLREVEEAAEPIRAVVHAAGLPQSETLDGMGLDSFAAVSTPKAAGALHLDELLGDRELDAFVMFSSIAATWGSGGQAAYAAGNSVLDALALDRRARGLAATSVQWGAWAGSGMAADETSREALARRGIRAMAPEAALSALRTATGGVDAVVAVADIDWELFTPAFTALRPSPLLSALPETAALRTGRAAPVDGGAGAALRTRLAGVDTAGRRAALLDLVRAEAAAVLGHGGAAGIDPGRPFRELGFDSLTAVE